MQTYHLDKLLVRLQAIYNINDLEDKIYEQGKLLENKYVYKDTFHIIPYIKLDPYQQYAFSPLANMLVSGLYRV